MLRAGLARRRPRDPHRTRALLLHTAFRQMRESGFQSTDLDTILARAGVTKGALYHHFDGKDGLGHAVVDEIVGGMMREKWLEPLRAADNPIDALIAIVRGTSADAEDVRFGCPLNNLAQELSPVDETFRVKLAQLFRVWQDAIAAALRRGRTRGLVRFDVHPSETAAYIVALYEGYISLAKAAQDPRVVQSGVKQIVRYLESLRP